MQSWFRRRRNLVRTAAGGRPFYDAPSVKTTTWSVDLSGVVLIAGVVLVVTLGRLGFLAVGRDAVCLVLSFAMLRLTLKPRHQWRGLLALPWFLKPQHSHGIAAIARHIGGAAAADGGRGVDGEGGGAG